MKKQQSELVFVPSPGVGHLVSAVEIAKLLVDRCDRLHVTVLILNLPFDCEISNYIESLFTPCGTDRLKFVKLPPALPIEEEISLPLLMNFVIQKQVAPVKEAVEKIVEGRTQLDSPRLVGFIVDMFCTSMIDVANEFGVPAYLYFASNAAFLDLFLRLQELYDENDRNITQLIDSDTELTIPSFVNSVSLKSVLPNVAFDGEGADALFYHARRFREVKGIIVNSFLELESRALNSFSDGRSPPVYPAGPLVNLKSGLHGDGGGTDSLSDIMEWLDDQIPSTVVFLCFGSMGSFGYDQTMEIARALEKSGVSFLWALRLPLQKGKFGMPNSYSGQDDILPEGFIDRTAGKGRVIGWAPQTDVLAHKAIGGFVSHCGWNSVLESLWYGAPIATWPLYGEQQMNAYMLAVELGLAVEIKLDYRNDHVFDKPMMVSADEIEIGIKKLMDGGDEIRARVKEMSEKSRKALMDGGSSSSSVDKFIANVLDH